MTAGRYRPLEVARVAAISKPRFRIVKTLLALRVGVLQAGFVSGIAGMGGADADRDRNGREQGEYRK